MKIIEMEIEFGEEQSYEKVFALSERLMNGTSMVGRKHGKWVLFIACPASDILHLGQELHYELAK